MKKNKISTIIGAVAIVTLGFMGCGAFAQSTQQRDSSTLLTSSNQYVGTYYAVAKMTNSNSGPYYGTYNIQPPTNASTGTFSDASGFPAPYSSSVMVVRKSDGYKWYTNNNNSVTFPATNTITYTLTAYVNSVPPPPTNGQTLTLQIQWNTNSP